MVEIYMEDEEKIGDNQEVMDAEHEVIHQKEGSKKDMINVYLEDKKEKEEEEKRIFKEAEDKAIEIEDIYLKRSF